MTRLHRADLFAAAIAAGLAAFSPAAWAEEPVVPPVLPNPAMAVDAVPGGAQDATGRAIQAALAIGRHGGTAIETSVLDGVRDFYVARAFAPVWLPHGAPTRQMTALRAIMDDAASRGLDPVAYESAEWDRSSATPEDLAAAEVDFSRAVALFVTQLQSGRLQPGALGKLVTLEPERPDVAAAIERLSRTVAPALAVSRYEPPQAQYRALKAKLAELSAEGPRASHAPIPEGAALKPGARDARTAALRQRLGVEPAADAEVYDPALVEAVKGFQTASGLTADGVIGPQTVRVLNGASREDDMAAIVVNMERWRWMPRDLGRFHVFVNVPEFVVRLVKDGDEVHQTRVVVGAKDHQTPIFSNRMSHLVVNPYWNVPVSIVTNEMLPQIRRNPSGYFASKGYQVLAKSGGKMRVVDPDSIDWGMINPRTFRIRQIPGDENALGRIKFMFPNQHSVYLHDTPSKALFRKDYRAYSHGCVRVDEPLRFADALLAEASPDWNSRRLEKLYGGPERRINLAHEVPVHLAYFTVAVGPEGGLRRFEDVYGYDAVMRERLGPQG